MTSLPRLLIDEHIRPDSVVVRTFLRRDGARVHVEVEPGTSGALSVTALLHVMRRYAKPLEDEVVARLLTDAPRLTLSDDVALAVLHWRAAVDAAGRDWLVLIEGDAEPIATLGAGVAAALRYLVARLEEERGGSGGDAS